jgi:plasmid stabilization system protein ParE
VKRRFRLTPEARADLRDSLLDIAGDSPETAERLRGEFYEALRHLGQSPGIGHYHEELLDNRHRFAPIHDARDLSVFFCLRRTSSDN